MSPVHLDVNAGRNAEPAAPLNEAPFRIALVGDWSGRAGRCPPEAADRVLARPIRRVDRDDLDEVLGSLQPELALRPGADAPLVRLDFERLEDFHPDQLFARLPIFDSLRRLRARLANPASYTAAARELAGASPAAPPPVAPGRSLLADILDAAAPPTAEEALAQSGGDLQAFLDRVLRPHLVPKADPRQGELVGQVDAAASVLLRSLLHAPAFRALEARWRALDLLVRQIDTGPELHLDLIDLTEGELGLVLPPGGDPAESPLYRFLGYAGRKEPWALLVADLSFGPGRGAVDRLAQLGCIGALLHAPWLAGAEASLVGADSLADARPWRATSTPEWQAFRATILARHVGLALPRFLVRAPYGRDGEVCEQLSFEESEPSAAPNAYLWGPPGFLVALVLARAYAESGWRLGSAIDPEVGGLPYVVTGAAGDRQVVPTAEVLMTEAAADHILAAGVMPIATLKDQDRVRLVRLQSVAAPHAALEGRWSA